MKLFKLILRSVSFIRYYRVGRRLLNDPHFKDGQEKSRSEAVKRPKRTEVINFLLSKRSGKTRYLEIGVRNPDHNYNHITSDEKYGVDPGLEYEENPVEFKMTSDEFYAALSADKILSSAIRFDVIYIDGLHLAGQVDKDIVNSLQFIKDDGFIVLHDCNPPTAWHAREDFHYLYTPAGGDWNGTTWKAFLKWRLDPSVYSCCIDSDWGIGILSKGKPIGGCTRQANPFFEFREFAERREKCLNLMTFDAFKKLLARTG